MRKLVMVPVVVAAMGFLALANADGTPPAPAPSPSPAPYPKLVPVKTASILSVTIPSVRSALGTSLTTKIATPANYEIEVDNPGADALKTAVVFFSANNTLLGEIAVTVPAKSTAKALLPVDKVIEKGCEPTIHRFRLKGTTETKSVKTTPSCTFTSVVNDPEASLSAAEKDAARANKVFYLGAVQASSGLACGSPLAFKAMVRNMIPAPAVVNAGIVIDFPGGHGTPSASLTFNGVSSKAAIATLPSFPGHAGDYVLKVDSLPNTPVYQPQWGLKVSRQCTYVAVPD
jgi:hypothetical protein